MPTATVPFGALLKRARLAAGLTQEALAERAAISTRAVSDLERDGARAPRLETAGLEHVVPWIAQARAALDAEADGTEAAGAAFTLEEAAALALVSDD